jgi:ribosomal protein S18 acetylase RimI-like enzyme
VSLVIEPLGGAPPPWELLLDADPFRARVEAYLPESQCLVARRGGAVLGVLVLRGDEILNLAVSPFARGGGIGRALLDAAAAAAREGGHGVLRVGTGNSSLGNLGFYQKCGFRITGVDRDFFTRLYPDPITEDGIPCRDLVLLERPLALVLIRR